MCRVFYYQSQEPLRFHIIRTITAVTVSVIRICHRVAVATRAPNAKIERSAASPLAVAEPNRVTALNFR